MVRVGNIRRKAPPLPNGSDPTLLARVGNFADRTAHKLLDVGGDSGSLSTSVPPRVTRCRRPSHAPSLPAAYSTFVSARYPPARMPLLDFLLIWHTVRHDELIRSRRRPSTPARR